jgi:hypothetical protein
MPILRDRNSGDCTFKETGNINKYFKKFRDVKHKEENYKMTTSINGI